MIFLILAKKISLTGNTNPCPKSYFRIKENKEIMKSELIKGIAIGMVAGAGLGMALKPDKSKTRALSKTAKSIGNAIETIGGIFGF